MGHARAALGMVVVTLLWSTAGVVSRHLQAAESFEVTFFRSLFNLVGLGVALTWMRGASLWTELARAPRVVWMSGVCWAVMFTAFMVALTMTRVANVLVTMSISPLLTALFARVFLRHRLPPRTWVAIAVAGAGIAWMFGRNMQAADARSLAGMAVAILVPLSTALNYTVLHHAGRAPASAASSARELDAPGADGTATPGEEPDMLAAVLIGAALSALVTLPIAWPFRATPHDLALLFGLGIFQLAIPCLLLVRLTRELASPEVALLGLLEVIFGVLWAWIGVGESPGSSALVGGALVVGALAFNELLSLRARGAARSGAH
ncbi:MAG TPA: DMT family transporter [Burkholderiaceae bacterium]